MTIQGSQLRIAPKNPVRVATTANVTLGGGAPDMVDGIALAASDRILVQQQSTASENGIYQVQTLGTGANGTWIRSDDFDGVMQDQIEAGVNTYIQEGTTHEKKTFYLTTPGAITIGVTNLTFEEGPTAGGGSIGGSTGSVDNAILRADGVGGATLQGGAASNSVLIDDTGNVYPETDDGGALGSVSNQWSDLFMASGGVINFNNGNVTVTHAANQINFAGASTGGFRFDNPMYFTERAAALADVAGLGQLWVRNDSPNVLVFTDDTGTDTVLGAGGGSTASVVKEPTRAATATDITLSGGAPDTLDGVSLSASDRILVWNQTTGSENGIYTVQTLGTGANGTWIRASDFDDAIVDGIYAGNEVYVQEGDIYGQVKFLLTTTGTITIGATALEFIPMGGLVRTDASSEEVQASTTFGTTTKWTSNINMRDHNEVAIWFDPTDLNGATVTDVTIVIAWSDDASTIPFSAGEYNQQSDFNITNQSDGSFFPKTYTANLTTAGGELSEGVGVHLAFPKRGGFCRIGVTADTNGGAYTVRAQRLVV